MSEVLSIGGLTIGAGEIVALLGGNGAGKTALLETILGFRPQAASACSGAMSGRSRSSSAWRWAWATCPRAGASSPA